MVLTEARLVNAKMEHGENCRVGNNNIESQTIFASVVGNRLNRRTRSVVT